MSAVDTIEVTPSGAVLAATVEGIDLNEPLDADQVQSIRDALHRHEVLFFRAQSIPPEAQLAFGRHFGTLHTHAALDALDTQSEVVVFDSTEGARLATVWHSDLSCSPQPSLGSILQMVIAPDHGGNTHWASTTAAYDALDDDTKARIASLHAYHESWWQPTEQAVHPVVRTHPATGRKGIYVNRGFTKRIVGLGDDESRELLDLLCEHTTRPEFTVEHSWGAGDIAFWDNRVTQHRVDDDFGDQRRRGHRVTINGDTPF